MAPASQVRSEEASVNKADAAAPAAGTAENSILLIKTATCPNCRIAAGLLDKAGIHYTPILAEENPDLVERYDVVQAPTLIVTNGDSYTKLVGVSDIRGWMTR